MPDPVSVLCVGGTVIDHKFTAAQPVRMATSNPIRSRKSFGGVARNVAENLVCLGVSCRLFSAVGDDEAGHRIIAHLRKTGVDADGIRTLPGSTATYIAALNPDGNLAVAFADMAIFDRLTPDVLEPLRARIGEAEWLFADCNLPAATLEWLIEMTRDSATRLAVDVVSVAKAARLPDNLGGIELIFANQDEAAVLMEQRKDPETMAQGICDRGAAQSVVTLGGEGCVLCGPQGTCHVPAVATAIVDVTGAGDALVSGVLSGLVAGDDLVGAAYTGVKAAAAVVASAGNTIARGDVQP